MGKYAIRALALAPGMSKEFCSSSTVTNILGARQMAMTHPDEGLLVFVIYTAREMLLLMHANVLQFHTIFWCTFGRANHVQYIVGQV